MSELEVQFGIIDKAEQPDDGKQPNINFNSRFERIIKTAHAKTGKQVVLLIDEYDTLMLNTITDIETQKQVRTHMSNLFSPIKDLDPQLKFVFITSITKFSQMSIFSTLNYLTDISLNARYCTLCGFTEEALRQIDEKEYEKKFSFDCKHVWKIGVNFSSEKRTVDEWKIEG